MRRREEDGSVGEDSFLDTTANLVGILIILVVVVGSKTQVDAAAHSRKLAEAEVQVDLSEPAALRESHARGIAKAGRRAA